MERAVARGQARRARRLPSVIGVDEKAARKGHHYLSLVCDLERATVEYIAPDREAASLDGYFEQFSADELAQVQAVATDRWLAYVNSIGAHLPDPASKIVFDRFHIMRHMGNLETARAGAIRVSTRPSRPPTERAEEAKYWQRRGVAGGSGGDAWPRMARRRAR
jgi:transposase